jgi:RNA polymerase sigma-70 factor (sigma-E family)
VTVARHDDDEYVEFASHALRELRRTAYLLCGDWHQAEDAAQEVLIRLYRRWPRVERREGLKPYVRRALIRILIDQSRRPWRREVMVDDPPEVVVPEAVRAVDDRMVLIAALDRLPVRRRACLVLRYFDDLSVRETASALGCSEGTVKSQTAHGLDDLRRVLDDMDVEPAALGIEEGWAS